MPIHSDQTKVLAQAIVEIRILLSGYLGSENEGPLEVRQAAHLAYALHNQALAVLEGKSFDVQESIKGLAFSDSVLESDFKEKFKQAIPQNA